MCTTMAFRPPDEAARDLARLMERQLGYSEGHIDSVALRLFIQAYWSRVSTYAHAIHEGRERTEAKTEVLPLCQVCESLRINCVHGQADRNAWRMTGGTI